jgi:hypothetical protein
MMSPPALFGISATLSFLAWGLVPLARVAQPAPRRRSTPETGITALGRLKCRDVYCRFDPG